VVDPRKRPMATGDAAKPSPGLRPGGTLSDVLPTILDLKGLDKPAAMTGVSLLTL
jgi:2,3-bisphosphoglycerate-independent phosphoglycerate mutase